MNRTKFATYAALLLTVVLSGCTSVYVPPDKPAGQLAYVREYKSADKHTNIEIKKVNGELSHGFMEEMGLTEPNPFKKEFWIDSNIGSEVFAINPGPCTLDITYSDFLGEATGNISFDAQAKRTYQVKSNLHTSGNWFKSQYVIFYVVDVETGLPVSDLPEEYRQALIDAQKNGES